MKTLAGQPETLDLSALDRFDDACTTCKNPGPTAHVCVIGNGQTATGKICTDCLHKLVEQSTRRGDAMVTAMTTGGIFRQLLQPSADGTVPDQTGTVTGQIEDAIHELSRMVETDPHRGTEYEVSFLQHNKERARQIGANLFLIGGHGLMVGVNDTIRNKYGTSARHLDYAWDGVGQWRA